MDVLEKRDQVKKFIADHPQWDVEAIVEQFELFRTYEVVDGYLITTVYVHPFSDVEVITVWKRTNHLRRH